MTSWGVLTSDDEQPVRRVREEVKDRVVVCVFSVGASTLVAIAITLISKLAG